MKKKNTDIGDFKVTVVPTTKPNVSLDSMRTLRASAIEKKVSIRRKRLRNSTVRVNKLLKDIEES